MNTVDPLNQSLYFTAVSSAAGEAAREAKKKEKSGAQQKAGIFSAMLKKNEIANELASAGLPAEIAGMSAEDAVVFLKDRVTIACRFHVGRCLCRIPACGKRSYEVRCKVQL